MSNPSGPPEPLAKLDDLNEEGRRIQELVEKLETLPDPTARAMLQECLQSVLSFYGQGLTRIFQIVERSGREGAKVREALLKDGGVSGLLLIHGLHPVSLETRLKEALEKVRPYMQSHGGDVELLSLENDFARLRLQGHCETCPSSTVTLELAVRHAIEEACPDLAGFEVEGMTKNGVDSGSRQFEHAPHAAPQWIEIPNTDALIDSGMLTIHEGNEPLIVCKVEDQFYAYYDRCPACNMPLHLGSLKDGTLSCHLKHRYDVRRAGRGLEGNSLHLEPLPLLVQNGLIKLALAPSVSEGNPLESHH